MSEDEDIEDESAEVEVSASAKGPLGPSRWSRLGGAPRRPGDRDPLQSPLVMWLFGGAVVLVLASAVLWSVLQRSHRERDYAAAKAELDGERYRQAVALYEAFLLEHAESSLAAEARRELARARVLREIDTATPDWAAGLAQVNAYIDEFREDESFDTMTAEIQEYADTIAFGAAREAERIERGEPLDVFDAARPVAVQYAPAEDVEELRARLDAARTRAEDAILRRGVYDEAIAEIDTRLADNHPLEALESRLELLDRFPTYARNQTVGERFAASLAAVAANVQVDLDERGPIEADADSGARTTTFVRTQRNRADRAAGEQRDIVIAYAGGSCFGVEAATGTPVWRRALGTDRAFFPVETLGAVPGLLVFDEHRRELQHLELATGRPIWRQLVDGRPTGPPAVGDGTVHLATTDGRVLQIDSTSGRLLGTADCGQRLSTAAVPLSGGRLLVAGEFGIGYVFDTAPLSLADAVYLGQRRGTATQLVHDGPQVRQIGPYVLLVENDRVESARLQLLDDGLEGDPPVPVAEARLPGEVYDPIAVRGRWLYVPFGRERVAAFSLSAEPGQPALVETARLSRPGADVPCSILPGPAEEFWMASSSVRRYRILLDSIERVPGEAAEGLHTQPLRGIGNRLFAAHRMPSTAATSFLEFDRRTFDLEWRTTLADPIRGVVATPDGKRVVCLTSSGCVHEIAVGEIGESGFVAEATEQIPFDPDDGVPLVRVLDDGFLFAASANDDSGLRIWRRGNGPRTATPLGKRPRLPPVPLGSGFVVADQGVLELYLPGGQRLDYESPDGTKTTWSSLAATVGERAVIAASNRGHLVRLEHRRFPIAHLAAAATATGVTSVVPLGIGSDTVAVVDEENTLVVHGIERLDRRHAFPLPAAPRHSPWVVGANVLVETRDGKLNGFDIGGDVPPWSISLDGDTLAGPPILRGDRLVASTRGGALLWIAPRLGVIRHRLPTLCNLSGGPLVVGETIVVPTTDGSLLAVPANAAAEDEP